MEPPNPAWLRLLLIDISDTKPVAAAIDLDGAAASERFLGKIEKRNNRTWYRDDDGYCVSRYVGRTEDGIHVFKVDVSYGGSGVFSDLLFLRRVEEWVVHSGGRQKRYVLRSVGTVGLGDRFTGLALQGGVVRISRLGGAEELVDLRGLGG